MTEHKKVDKPHTRVPVSKRPSRTPPPVGENDHSGLSTYLSAKHRRFLESEARFRSIIETSYAGYFRVDKNGCYTDVNAAWLSMHGFSSKEEVIGKHFDLVAHPPLLADAKNVFSIVMAGTQHTIEGEFKARHRNGSVLYTTLSAKPILKDGTPVGIEGFTIDTTARKQAEKELLRQKNFFEVILERIISGVCAADREGRIYYVNRGMTTIAGMAKEDVLKIPSLLNLFTDRDAVLHGAYDRAKNSLQPIPYIAAPVVLPGTRLRYISGWFIPFITEGALDGMLLTAVDMTEREEAERARQEREEWTKLALEETDEGLWEWNVPEQQLIFHDNWPHRLGYDDMGPVVEESWWLAHITEESRRRAERQFREHREGRAKYHEFEYEIPTKTGESRWFWVRSKIIERTGDGRPLRVIGTHRDITDRVVSEEALRITEARYRDIVENTDVLIGRFDKRGRITYINKTATDFMGVDTASCIGMSSLDFIHPDDLHYTIDKYRQWVRDKQSAGTVENRYINKKTGAVWHLAWTITLHYDREGRLVDSHGIGINITDRIKLEEALRKAEKLESLGILAGGIAHDFNNLLTAILGNIELSLAAYQSGGDTSHNIQKAKYACDQAKELTQRFLTFSKGGNPKQDITPLAPIILASIEEATSGANVTVRHSLAPDLWTAAIDTEQMRQAIGNIIINAREAMPEGGIIFVKAENIIMGEKHGTSYPFSKAQYIKISIEDRGRGIAKENLTKIFDPYFTTKEMGTQKGMGLGLTVAYSIIARHNGYITADSNEGSGTTVTIYLPASSEVATERA